MNGRELFPRMRSMLLSAGNLEISRKLGRFDADLKVIDLEDGVPVAEKESGRRMTVETVDLLRGADLQGQLMIRVNAPDSEWVFDDLEAIAMSPIDGIVVPMVSGPKHVRQIEDALDMLGCHVPIMWGIETGRGVEYVSQILDESTRPMGIYFGSEDYATDAGLTRTSSNQEILYARSRVALAAANRGHHSMDKGYTDVEDVEGFREDAQAGKELGFTGKICVTPRQADVSNEVFLPTAAEIEYSTRLVAAYEAEVARGHSAPKIDGHMIDGPLVVRARKILVAAGLLDSVDVPVTGP